MNIKFRLLFIVFLSLWGVGVGSVAWADLDLTHVIRHVRIDGLIHLKDSQVPAFQKLESRIGQKWPPALVEDAISALYLSGYFSRISAKVVSRNFDTLVFTVSENAVVTRVQFEGNISFPSEQLGKVVTSSAQRVLNLGLLSKDKAALEGFYHQRGFDFMRITGITLLQDNTVLFSLSEGKLSRLTIEGLSTIEPRVALREFRMKPGDPFNSIYLREDRERLLKLGYFSDVSYPHLRAVSTTLNAVEVGITVREQKVNLIDIGLEEASNRVVLFLKNNWNHVLINSDLLVGKIQYGSDIGQSALRITSYSLGYQQPWFLNQFPFSMEALVWDELGTEYAGRNPTNQQLVDNQRKGQQLSSVIPVIRDRFSAIVRIKNETVTPLQALADTRAYVLRGYGLGLTYRDYLSPNNPKQGQFFGVEFEKGGNLGFIDFYTLDYTRVTVQGSQFIPLGPTSTFATHAFLGMFDTTGLTFNTFETESYVMGGSNALRGYKETDPYIGARKLLFNFEYRQDFTSDFQGVLFYDLGKVFDVGNFLGSDNFHWGYGFGMRYFTPIAPIRFDFAWSDQGQFIIHFGLGQAF